MMPPELRWQMLSGSAAYIDASSPKKYTLKKILRLRNICLFGSSNQRQPGIVHHAVDAELDLKNAFARPFERHFGRGHRTEPDATPANSVSGVIARTLP